MDQNDATQNIGAELEKNWDRHQTRNQGPEDQKDNDSERGYFEDAKDIFRVWKILVRIFGWNYVLGSALQLSHSLAHFAEPLLLK